MQERRCAHGCCGMHVKKANAVAMSMERDRCPPSSSSQPAESAQLVKSMSWSEYWRKHLLESSLASARRRQTCSGCMVEKSPYLTLRPSVTKWVGSSPGQEVWLRAKPVRPSAKRS